LPGPLAVKPLRVIDGDTFEGQLRIWFGQEVTTLVRLRNIDAPELKAQCEAEAKLAIEARTTLEEILR
jgi:endonuclease YncB( thermonuclease family)